MLAQIRVLVLGAAEAFVPDDTTVEAVDRAADSAAYLLLVLELCFVVELASDAAVRSTPAEQGRLFERLVGEALQIRSDRGVIPEFLDGRNAPDLGAHGALEAPVLVIHVELEVVLKVKFHAITANVGKTAFAAGIWDGGCRDKIPSLVAREAGTLLEHVSTDPSSHACTRRCVDDFSSV